MSRRRALITGITGQDGSYLTELLAAEGTQVHGFVKPGDPRLDDLLEIVPDVVIHDGDLGSFESVQAAIESSEPTRSTTWQLPHRLPHPGTTRSSRLT